MHRRNDAENMKKWLRNCWNSSNHIMIVSFTSCVVQNYEAAIKIYKKARL